MTEYLSGFAVRDEPDMFNDGYSDPLSTKAPVKQEPSAEVTQFEARKSALLADLQAWANTLTKFLQDHRVWLVGVLQHEHDKEWRQCKAQDAVVEELDTRLHESYTELQRLRMNLSRARASLNGHEADKPDLACLPSRGQVESWETRRNELQAAFAAIEEDERKALDNYRSLGREREREKLKQTSLHLSEERLRKQISGDVVRVGGLAQDATL